MGCSAFSSEESNLSLYFGNHGYVVKKEEKYFHIWDKNFHASLPEDIKNLSNLRDVCISHCKLTGTFPQWFQELKEIRSIQLCFNELRGPLPDFSKSFTHLTFLCLSHNGLSGPIAHFFQRGLMPLLEHLDLSHNAFSGHLPDVFDQYPRLNFLDLSHHSELCGTLPSSLANLHSLRNFYIAHTNIGGPCPPFFTSLKNLDLSFTPMDVSTFSWKSGHCFNAPRVFASTSLDIFTPSLLHDPFWDFIELNGSKTIYVTGHTPFILSFHLQIVDGKVYSLNFSKNNNGPKDDGLVTQIKEAFQQREARKKRHLLHIKGPYEEAPSQSTNPPVLGS